jgi:hypothetical protein
VLRHHRADSGPIRRWGPFSGGQLTTIIVAIVVMALFPVGAWAVSGSNSFVTDAASGQHASVNSTGALNVAQASPKSFFSAASTTQSTSDFVELFRADASHAFIVTSIVFNVSSIGTPGSRLRLAVSRGNSSCDKVALDPASNIAPIYFTPSGVGTVVEPFQPGFVVPAHRALCIANSDPASLFGDVLAYGFKVPAGSAPSGT